MKNFFSLIIGLTVLGAGCSLYKTGSVKLNNTINTTTPVSVTTTVQEPEFDPQVLGDEYDVAVLIAQGLDSELGEIDDWIQDKNWIDARDAGLAHFDAVTGDVVINEAPLFHDADKAKLGRDKIITNIHASMQVVLDGFNQSAELYAKAVEAGEKGNQNDVKKNLAAAQAKQGVARKGLVQVQSLIETWKKSNIQ